MASVNATRAGLAQNVTDATKNAELIGFNDEGNACVWSGGYSFTVYDAAREWQEVRHFTNGAMVDEKTEELAREQMESEGFSPV